MRTGDATYIYDINIYLDKYWMSFYISKYLSKNLMDFIWRRFLSRFYVIVRYFRIIIILFYVSQLINFISKYLHCYHTLIINDKMTKINADWRRKSNQMGKYLFSQILEVISYFEIFSEKPYGFHMTECFWLSCCG
jgi:hypothetical protein